MPQEDRPKEPTDPRILLAAERTFLAWVRTGIALMGFGFVVARFSFFLRELALTTGRAEPTHFNGPAIGVVVVAAGVLVNAWASVRHFQMMRALRAGRSDVGLRGPLAVGVATAIGGVILVVVLLGAIFG